MAHLFSPPLRVAAAVALLATLTQPAAAGPMTLADLLNGGSITVGDRVFSDFGNYSSVSSGGAAVDPSKVYVVPVVYGSSVGLRFDGGVQFRVGPNGDQDTSFTYRVSSTVAGDPIANGNLGFSGETTGGSTTTVTTGVIGQPSATLVASNTTHILSSGFLTPPQPSVEVSTDIHLHGGPGRLAHAILRHFHITSEAPEPASLTLLGLGGLGLVAYRWRRRRAT